MDIYKIRASHLEAIKEQPFQLEKEMQQLFETHLSLLTGLTLVKSEFPLKQFRFDTLAFDHEKQAFVVIEYKRDKNDLFTVNFVERSKSEPALPNLRHPPKGY